MRVIRGACERGDVHSSGGQVKRPLSQTDCNCTTSANRSKDLTFRLNVVNNCGNSEDCGRLDVCVIYSVCVIGFR